MSTIILRHNETGGVQPGTGTVAVGEVCVNTVDGTLFTSNDGNNIVPVLGGGGGGGDLPNGSVEGQMLKWTASGTPTWSVTDVIKTTTDDNATIGGDQFSSAYKLTVNGATYCAGTLNVTDFVTMANGMQCTQTATFGQINATTGISATSGNGITVTGGGQLTTNSNPVNSQNVGNRSYNDGRYLRTDTTTQSVAGSKTFSGATTIASLGISGGFGDFAWSGGATGSNEYLRLGTTGFVFTSTTLVAADVEFDDAKSLPDKLGEVLQAFAVAIGATPAQLTAVDAIVAGI